LFCLLQVLPGYSIAGVVSAAIMFPHFVQSMFCGSVFCLLQVLPGDSYHAAEELSTEDDPDLWPEMLLVNAMQHKGTGRARLVMMLLQRGPPALEMLADGSGETPLSTAARLGDAEVWA
jgi:hypothetical protein